MAQNFGCDFCQNGYDFECACCGNLFCWDHGHLDKCDDCLDLERGNQIGGFLFPRDQFIELTLAPKEEKEPSRTF